MTIGKFTPVITSTASESRNIEAIFVGVPPNISVIKRTPAPCETPLMARSTSPRALSTSSCQPIDTAAMCEIGPTIISAAASSSPARWPWLTMTPATLGDSLEIGSVIISSVKWVLSTWFLVLCTSVFGLRSLMWLLNNYGFIDELCEHIKDQRSKIKDQKYKGLSTKHQVPST